MCAVRVILQVHSARGMMMQLAPLLWALQRAATSALRVLPFRSARRAIRGLLPACN